MKLQIIEEIEKKRLNTIKQIKDARKELIAEKQKKEDFNKKYRSNKPIEEEDKNYLTNSITTRNYKDMALILKMKFSS